MVCFLMFMDFRFRIRSGQLHVFRPTPAAPHACHDFDRPRRWMHTSTAKSGLYPRSLAEGLVRENHLEHQDIMLIDFPMESHKIPWFQTTNQ